jgi:dihydrofolate reductase
MRKIIAQEMVSLDGFFAGPNGEIDWFVWDDALQDMSLSTLGRVDTLLFGRVTYEGMASYWPAATTEDPVIARSMNTLPKIVFSSSLKKADWNNTRVVNRIEPAEIVKMKQQPGKDMVIYGSGVIVSTLTRLGLIDEYRLVVNPIILGNGKPLFKGLLRKNSTRSSRKPRCWDRGMSCCGTRRAGKNRSREESFTCGHFEVARSKKTITSRVVVRTRNRVEARPSSSTGTVGRGSGRY